MNKEFYLNSLFTVKSIGDEGGDQESLVVEGYASTASKDRHGDIIPPEVWNKPGVLDAFRKNPIVLEQHDHNKPIGRIEELEVDTLGLKVKAKIFNLANSNVFKLVAGGVLKTFSIGFMLKDLDYVEEKDAWIIKDLELFEVSVVSVPANGTAEFSLAKSMSNEDYAELRHKFINKEETMSKDTNTPSAGITEDQIAELVAKQATRLREEEARKEREKAEREAEIKKAAEGALEGRLVSVQKDVTDKLLAAFEEKFAAFQEGTATKDDLAEIQESIKSRSAEFRAKGEFERNRGNAKEIAQKDIDTAIILGAHFKNKDVTETKFAQRLLEKSGMQHWESGTRDEWEEDFTTRVWEDLRRDLVIEDTLMNIQMTAQQMNLPISPDARYAQWITQANYRGPNSTGTADDHQLTEQTLKAYKLAAKEYLGYEEDEDSIIPLVPIIRSNLVRSIRKTSERALLRGAGSSGDPIKGLEAKARGAGALQNAAVAGQISVSDLHQTRKLLGPWGLNPSEVVYLVSMKAYYEIVEDEDLKTVEVAGDRATQFNGQIGMLHGSPVVVCSEFDEAALEAGTADTVTALAVNMRNFLIGNWRNLLIETDRDVEEQKQIMVATRRFGFSAVIEDHGVAALRNAAP